MVRFNKVWKTLEGYEFVSFQARIERDRVVRYLDFLEQKEPATLRPHACEDVGPCYRRSLLHWRWMPES